MSKSNNLKTNKFLVIFLSQGGLGEVILQTPFYKALKTDFPKAEIHILICKNNAKILENNPYIKTIYTYDSAKQLLGRFLQISSIAFQSCYIFDKTWKSIYLSKIFIKTKNFLGFERQGWESLPLTEKIKYDATKHESQYYIDLLRCNHSHDLTPQLFPKKSDFAILEIPLLQSRAPIIALLAGGANNPATGDEPFRRWPIENYCALANRLIDDGNIILLVGGKSDIGLNQKIESICRSNCINLTDKLNLMQSSIALSKAKLVICNDSGLMHLSSCFNQNLLCLLHMISPISIIPKVKNAHYFWVDEDIYDPKARIFGTNSIKKEKKELLLKRLKVDTVYEKTLQMLKNL